MIDEIYLYKHIIHEVGLGALSNEVGNQVEKMVGLLKMHPVARVRYVLHSSLGKQPPDVWKVT